EGGLVVGADDRSRQLPMRVEDRLHHLGAAGGTVVALPVGACVGGRMVGCGFLLESLLAGAVVRAVRSAGYVGKAPVAVVLDQVPDQRAHARLVVAANVHGA